MARPLKVDIEIKPTERATSLLQLVHEARMGGWRFGRNLRREVMDESRAWSKSLNVLEESLSWLEKQKIAYVDRRRASAGRTMPAYAHPVVISVDIRDVTARVGEENAHAEKWQLVAFALRNVLLFGERSVWIEPLTVKLNTRHHTLESLRLLLDELLAAHGCSFEKTQRGVTRAQRPVAVPPDTQPKTQRDTEHKNTTQPQPEQPATARPSASSQPSPTPDAHETEAPRTRRRTRKHQPDSAGFGGLPEDAESRPRGQEPVEMGPRGITLDAEFFLEQGKVAQWPCSRDELESARRRALMALHPDRVGEQGTRLFQRAVRGFNELVRWVETHSEPAVATQPPTASVRAKPLVGEWPPRPVQSSAAR